LFFSGTSPRYPDFPSLLSPDWALFSSPPPSSQIPPVLEIFPGRSSDSFLDLTSSDAVFFSSPLGVCKYGYVLETEKRIYHQPPSLPRRWVGEASLSRGTGNLTLPLQTFPRTTFLAIFLVAHHFHLKIQPSFPFRGDCSFG